MAQITRQGLAGIPRGLYGSFAGKTETIPPAAAITRLGLYGGPRGLYGSFSGKSLSTGISTKLRSRIMIKAVGRMM